MLLVLLTLTGLAWAQEVRYGIVVARDVNSLTVKSPQGEEYRFVVRPKTPLPAWLAPGQKVKVTCQELRVAVALPNGQRACQQAFELESVARWVPGQP